MIMARLTWILARHRAPGLSQRIAVLSKPDELSSVMATASLAAAAVARPRGGRFPAPRDMHPRTTRDDSPHRFARCRVNPQRLVPHALPHFETAHRLC